VVADLTRRHNIRTTLKAEGETSEMLSITNNKIAGFELRWAPFRGFSFLFDNPGDSFTLAGSRLDLAANLADPGLVFYWVLHESVVRLGKDHLVNAYLFCALPPASYHVTIWDGVNDGNIGQVPEAHRAEFQNLMAGFPDSVLQPTPPLDSLLSSPLTTFTQEIRFRFDRLGNWSNTSVVAELAPVDEASFLALQELITLRAAWNEEFKARFGISPSNPHHFAPHVTLGYFANREQAAQMLALQQDWNDMLTQTMRNGLLALRGISLYGFTDMATFFKRATPE
jgi:hypothetical protein